MATRCFALALVLTALGCSPRTRPADVVSCTPGSMIQIGCAEGIGRVCRGDPDIRVCDGSTPPADCIEGATTQIVFDDDGGGSSCPNAQLVCPASGRVTVVPNGPTDDDWVCAWAVGDIPITDRLAASLSCTPGAMLAAGCDDTIGMVCRGDPTIRVCEGDLTAAQCIAVGTPLVQDDDGGNTGLCPLGRFTCPPSGRITVVPQGFSGRDPSQWDCFWDVGVPGI